MYVKKGQKKVKKKCPKCIYNYGHKYSPSKTSAHIQYIQYNVICIYIGPDADLVRLRNHCLNMNKGLRRIPLSDAR